MPHDKSLAFLQPATRAWFERSFAKPTPAQAKAFGPISKGKSTLLLAPTGSGKTLAAFLVALDRLLFEEPPTAKARCRVLYVSPIKALAFDIEKNLRAPLAGITSEANAAGATVQEVRVDLRTGDTSPAERARIQRVPPDILVTTPESLYLMLTSGARSVLASVDTVIVDEIHSFVATKRGAHFFLSLERLEALRPRGARPLQRIGLSATLRPIDEAAALLGGRDADGARPVTIADGSGRRALDVRIEVPVDDMSKLGEEEDGPPRKDGSLPRRSIWPSIYPRVLELVRAHRSTMIFVNSRRLAERLAGALNEAAGEEIVACHHGSLSRETRLLVEDRLKRGLLPAIVATSSLELGVDMGAVDLVIQIEAPPSVSSALQRVGRAGHGIGRTSEGVIFPKHRGDLLAAAAVRQGMLAGDVEKTRYPRQPLDILAQQIVAHVASQEHEIASESVLALVRGAAPFADLSLGTFENVLDMLSGRYPSDDFAELRPRLVWDRVKGTLRGKPGSLRLAIVSGGTIPDRGLYGVFLATASETSRRVGELDEEMVFEAREGEVVILGTSSWRIEEIGHDRVLVTPAPGEPGKMPFWRGDRPSRPFDLGRAIGALTRVIGAAGREDGAQLLTAEHGLDALAAKNLASYVADQQEATGALPTDRHVVIERYRDDMGDQRVCVLSPYGSAVHAPWATTVVNKLRERAITVDVMWTDDGMVFRLPEADDDGFRVEDYFPAAADVQEAVLATLSTSAVFATRFRENAARSLLLPRKMPGRRTPLWAQRKRAGDLLAVASRFPDFPVVLETYRECLSDVFDLDGLAGLLREVESRKTRVTVVDTHKPSPFASSLMFSYVAQFLYEGDAPLAERRAQALRIDHDRLRELLGEAELRRLLDPEVIATTEARLQRLGEHRARRDADGIHDLLLSLGDLAAEQIAQRTVDEGDVSLVLDELVRTRRAFSFGGARKARFAAAEDTARYRDGLGIAPPVGLPAAFLAPVAAPLGDLVSRFARTHGPFPLARLAAQWGVKPAALGPAVLTLMASGKLLEGAFLPEGDGRELVHAEVLKTLRQRSLARLREEIEPVSVARFAAFALAFHGLGDRRRTGLLAVVESLEGAPIPASVLERDVLAARLDGFDPARLDALFLSGELVWGGVDAIGPSDGRLALYLREHEPLLSPPPRLVEGPVAAAIREALTSRGALFFPDLVRLVGGFPNEIFDVLWSMVWSGELTNDTLLPVRSLLAARSPRVFRTGSRVPGTEGRWSLRAPRLATDASATERAAALVRTLLARHGVLLREAPQAEGIPGGFSAVYPVLKALEERGEIRRGYFVAGCGALQFARPGADDTLRRDQGDMPPLAIAATDPAQVYGAALPWPDEARGRLQRVAGAYVLSVNGQLAGYLGRGERTLTTVLPEDEAERQKLLRGLVAALRTLLRPAGRKVLLLATIDGLPALQSPLLRDLLALGLTPGTAGLLLRSEAPRTPPLAPPSRHLAAAQVAPAQPDEALDDEIERELREAFGEAE